MKKFTSIICCCFCIFIQNTLSQNQYIDKDTLIVARDGTGDFRNIQDGINSIQATHTNPTVILIKNGIYKEKIVLPTEINGLSFIGEDKEKTIITYDDHAKIDNMGTFKTYTFYIQGNDITFENLTIENNAAQLGQAVAVHIEGDRIIFRNCRFLGNQDTIYAGRENCRQYFVNCYIEGTTDFIFGPSICWFEACNIHCKKDSYITAASTPEQQAYGYIFNNCKITLESDVTKMHLGRPWRPYAMTLFMNSELPWGILPEGWDNWRKEENEKTTRYMEYNNHGEGAKTAGRVAWSKKLSEKEASIYTLKNVMKGNDGWLPE